MANVSRKRRRLERGQIIPIVVFGIFGLLSMVALAVDLGYWRYEQRLQQAAADGAAVAGAIQLNYPTTASTNTPVTAAQSSAALDGFQDDAGVGNLTVTVSTTPAPPPRPNATAYPPNTAVEVKIRKKQPLFFAGIFGQPAPFVSARAVAVTAADFSACLYQLELVGAGGELTFKGSKSVQTVNCGVAANGPINAGFGGTTTSLSWYGATAPVTNFTGPIRPLAQPVTDPCYKIPGCAYLQTNPVPAKSSALNISTTNFVASPPTVPGYEAVVGCCLSPTTFGPGLYYVYGGVSGTIVGDGVTIVNVDGAFTASGLGATHPYFSAPTSGPSAGIAYFQPPSNMNGITLNGGGNQTSSFDGTFYAPTAGFLSNGGSTTFSFLISGAIRENGGGSGLGIVVDPTLGSQITPSSQSFPTHVVLDQ